MYKTLSGFYGSVILRNRPFNVSYSYSFGFDKLKKMQTFFVETVQELVRNYMEVIEDISKYVKKYQIRQMSNFHPYANFNYQYLKIGLCNLLPDLLECITF